MGRHDPKALLASCPYDHETLWLTYQEMHEAATGMGYPSVTEALEHLSELLTRKQPAVSIPELPRVTTPVRQLDPDAWK